MPYASLSSDSSPAGRAGHPSGHPTAQGPGHQPLPVRARCGAAPRQGPWRARPHALAGAACLALAGGAPGGAWAQATAPAPPATAPGAADDAALRIGTVVVTGTPLREAGNVSAATLRDSDLLTVGAALEAAPGVVQSKVGARNEQMVYVRGFDLRQVPVFIDGVPVYVPYDGYADLGRFTTFDLARLQVQTAGASLLYGANTLGGAINLVGKRPTRPLELDAGLGLLGDGQAHASDAGWASLNLGLRQGPWYAQLSGSYLEQQRWTLPAGFTPAKAEDGGTRNNSDSRDSKAALKLGWTPGGDDEYALHLIEQNGQKGTPPYAGSLSSVTPRYWRWPTWDKQSTYLLTRTGIGAHVLKLRAWHDVFRNALYTYDDASYATQAKASSFRSFYDDYTNGLSAQFDAALGSADTLGLAAHWKRDIHREHNAGEPVRVFDDETQSLAAEDRHRFSPATTLVAGVGHDRRLTHRAEDYNSSTRRISEFQHGSGSAFNALLALEQQAGADWLLRATLSRKSRFPTLKDRYSYRLGTALPNADLAPEKATHLELAADGRLAPGATVNLALFRSEIRDLIQSVTVSTLCGASACTQAQNINRARSQGLELGGRWQAGALTLDGHWQLLDRKNLSNSLKLTDTPRQQARLHAAWALAPAFELHGEARAASRRWSSSDGLQEAGGFAVYDLKLRWNASQRLALDASVHNLADKLYALTEGFPEPGRQLLLQARLRWD